MKCLVLTVNFTLKCVGLKLNKLNFAVKLTANFRQVFLTVKLQIFNCKMHRFYCKMCRFYSLMQFILQLN